MIKYDGKIYQLNTLIQFDALQNFLEALAKKQVEHDILLYGLTIENSEINKFPNSNNNVQQQNEQNNELNQNVNEAENVNDSSNFNSKGLIQEMKFCQEKIKQLENRINNLENKDYKREFIDSLGVQVKSNKKDIESLQRMISEMDKKNAFAFKQINDEIKTKITLKELDSHEKKIIDSINTKITNVSKELNEKNSKLLEKEITKLNSAINKNTVDINNCSEKLSDFSEKFSEKLSLTNEQLSKKATKGDVEQLTNKITNYEKSINNLLTFQKDQNKTNNKHMSAISSLKEALNKMNAAFSPLAKILSNQKIISSLENMDNIIAKMVDIDDYNVDIAHINKNLSKLETNLKEYTKALSDLLLTKKAEITMDDLNNLEKILKELINQQNIDSQKKFADKTGVNKSLHSLEGQLKNLISDFDKEKNKEIENADVCMLSSKPLDGYKCASCEKYIGDLKENIQYLPWNKFPNEILCLKRYRMGNGISRILQSMNIEDLKDLKNSMINENTGEGAIKNISITNVNNNGDANNYEKSISDNECEKGKNKNNTRNKNKFPVLKANNTQTKMKNTKTYILTEGDEVKYNVLKINGKELDSKIKKRFINEKNDPESKNGIKVKKNNDYIVCCEKGDNTERNLVKNQTITFNFNKPPLNKNNEDNIRVVCNEEKDEKFNTMNQKQFSKKEIK